MPERKLVCPSCGHDGTPETAKFPVECCGFNYLEDNIACRDILGYDDQGKLRLARGLKHEGTRGTNPRIECRSCWQTFPLPGGVELALSPDEAAVPGVSEDRIPAPEQPSEEVLSGELRAVAQQMAEDLARVFNSAVQQVRRLASEDLKRLETAVTEIRTITEGTPALRGELTSLLNQTESLAEAGRQLSVRLDKTESQVLEHQQSNSQVKEEMGRLSAGQEEIRQQVQSQTGNISALEQGIRQLESLTPGLQELIEQRTAAMKADLSKVNERLETLDRLLREQAEAAARLDSVCSQFGEAQETLQKRLDSQAEAIRAVHLAAQAHASHREELRAALQKLEEIAGALDQPKTLPQDL